MDYLKNSEMRLSQSPNHSFWPYLPPITKRTEFLSLKKAARNANNMLNILERSNAWQVSRTLYY